MRIEEVSIPNELAREFELAPVQMKRLGKVVLIAGQNGSGKTRLFSLVRNTLNNYPNDARSNELKRQMGIFKDEVAREIQNIENYQAQLDHPLTSDEQKVGLQGGIQNSNFNITNSHSRVHELERQLSYRRFLKVVPDRNSDVVDFVPKGLILTDSYNISQRELDTYADRVYSNGVSEIHQGSIPEIERVLKRWINIQATTDDLEIEEHEKLKIKENYDRLKNYIRIFLNADLKRSKDGHPQIFGRRIGEALLSDGQTVLLQFCMALYAQETSLDQIILFMDEPENHLHPAALMEVLDRIIPAIPNGQLWIATHSVNVLAHFDPSNIWYINKGTLSYAGAVPENVLKGLLGSEDEISRLTSFLELPSQMACDRFALQCLLSPSVLKTPADDPQLTQIYSEVKKNLDHGTRLKVLDYGIGRGRLLASIIENDRLREIKTPDWLDFYGYDISAVYSSECTEVFKSIYPTSEVRYYNDETSVLTKQDRVSFDYVIMCNVFHEIDPAFWLKIFDPKGLIVSLLKDDGYLLIVEDQQLAVGETAHSKGFLVLDELEFKRLFSLQSADNYQVSDHRGDGRLKCHKIPKQCLMRIKPESRKEAIETLIGSAKLQIEKIRRSNDRSFKSGKLLGFWTQQLANASLALDDYK